MTMTIDRGTHEARNALQQEQGSLCRVHEKSTFIAFSLLGEEQGLFSPTFLKTIKTRETPTSCLVKTSFTKDDYSNES